MSSKIDRLLFVAVFVAIVGYFAHGFLAKVFAETANDEKYTVVISKAAYENPLVINDNSSCNDGMCSLTRRHNK